jgi:hypothetical protein
MYELNEVELASVVGGGGITQTNDIENNITVVKQKAIAIVVKSQYSTATATNVAYVNSPTVEITKTY